MASIKKKIKKARKKIRKSFKTTFIYRGINKVWREIKKFFHKYYLKYEKKKIMKTTPIQNNKIAIMTNTYTYTCNPKYIYEELIRRKLDYQIVWLVNRKNFKSFDYPENVKLESITTKDGIKEVYSSKIWIDNGIAFSNSFDKREGQIHIQTMHGSLGIKRLDNAVLARNARGKSGQIVVQRESNETDYVITNSQFEEDVFHTVFWKNTPMVRLGHARTDVLFETNEDRIDEIRADLLKRYNIPKDKKLILYAPTHRKDMTAEDLSIDYADLIKVCSERFGGEFVVLIRMHSRTKNVAVGGFEGIDSILFDVSDYPDIQELMLVTSVGITDYSSWIYDYVNTRKPGFIFATDLERYNNNTGLYYPLEETPFPVCKSHAELHDKVLSFDNELFVKRCNEFLDEKQAVDDGNSAKRIVDWIQTLAPITEE